MDEGSNLYILVCVGVCSVIMYVSPLHNVSLLFHCTIDPFLFCRCVAICYICVMDIYTQVSTNGYLSVSLQRSYTNPVIPGDTYIISPYGADIDLRIAGTVRYSNGFLSYHSQMSSVSSFIRTETGKSFYGNKMMVAEWDRVAKLSGNFVS